MRYFVTTSQCAERLARLGPNHLELAAGRRSLRILLEQFSNALV